MRERPPAATQRFPFSFDSKSSLCRSPPSRVSSEDPSPPSTCRSVFSLTDRTLSSLSPSQCHPLESDTLYELERPVPRQNTTPETTLVAFQESPKPRQLATISTFSVLSSLRFSPIPRPLRTSLSFLGQEHFQISDTTSSELDMSLCAFLFPRMLCLDVVGADLVFSAASLRSYD